MSAEEKKKRLEELATRRKARTDAEKEKLEKKEKNKPKSITSRVSSTTQKSTGPLVKTTPKRSISQLEKGSRLIRDDYDDFIVDDDKGSDVLIESDEIDEEFEVSDDSLENSDDSSDKKKKKKKKAAPNKKKPSSKNSKPKPKSTKRKKHSSDEDSEIVVRSKSGKKKRNTGGGDDDDNKDDYDYSDVVDEDDLQEEADGLDTSNIIKSERRTRGKRLDYREMYDDSNDLQ